MYLSSVVQKAYKGIKDIIYYLATDLARNNSQACSLKEQEEVVNERNPSRSSW